MSITISGTTLTFNDATTQTTAATTSIPTGSVVLFYQAAAPTGWTQVTTLNDYDLRLVSGAGGTTGGTTAYSTVFANQTPTISNGTLAVGATTLSTSQIPSHTHDYTNPDSITTGGCGKSGSNYTYNTTATGATGGGNSHTHSLSGAATSSAITLNVRYANIIICSKN